MSAPDRPRTEGGRPAPVEHDVATLIAERWSPRAFAGDPVDPRLLRRVFEAARWAPSSRNEQPWRFLVATSDAPEWLERLGSYLSDGNAWARGAPALVASAYSTTFARNGKPNRVAMRDLGAAEENLVLEAYRAGLVAHQMAGFDHERLERELLPEGFRAGSMTALGHPGDPSTVPDGKRRDTEPRSRRPLHETVFGPRWGDAAPFL